MMFKSVFFQPLWGEFDTLGEFSTEDLPITEADANSATGVTVPGKALSIAWATRKLVYATGRFMGFLVRQVSIDGTRSDAWRRTWTENRGTAALDPPLRRGAMAALFVYRPGSFIELEGTGVASVDTNVITSGTGALSAATPVDSELTVEKGGWRLAANGEYVFGFYEVNLAIQGTVGNVRFLLRTCSPYKKTA